MNRLKIAVATILVVVGISLPSFAQHRSPERRPGVERRYDRNRQYRRGGGRVVVLPRLTLRFPQMYRGRYVASAYNIGLRDGFERGREDFRAGWPCSTDFRFNRRHSDYEAGFLKGYADSCDGGDR